MYHIPLYFSLLGKKILKELLDNISFLNGSDKTIHLIPGGDLTHLTHKVAVCALATQRFRCKFLLHNTLHCAGSHLQ